MSAAALTLLLVAALPSAPAQVGAAAQARVEARAREVELGQPVELDLVVLHPAGTRVTLDAAALDGDPTWAALEGGERLTLPAPDAPGRAVTRARWTLVSLEPGKRELPAPGVSLVRADGTEEPLEVARGLLSVAGVLAPVEDAPRPLAGFVGLDAPERPARLWIPGTLALIAGLGALVWWLRRRARRAPAAPAAVPTPLQRLEALASGDLDTDASVRAAHFELTRALREQVDQRLGREHAGLTDEEWLPLVRQRLGADVAKRLGELLAACAEVKFGAATPTHWATRERVEAARELARSVVDDGAPRPSAEVAP